MEREIAGEHLYLLFSPQRIIFGGGMGMTSLDAEIRRTASRMLNGYPGIDTTDDALDRLIVMPGLGDRSGIAGTLILARQADTEC